MFVKYQRSFESTVVTALEQILTTVNKESVLGVGIGIPGIYDDAIHSVRISENWGLSDFPLEELERRIAFPVQVVNRANAAALGEKWYGSGKNISNLVYVYLGEGIGSGIILDNKLYKGTTGSAGELGHTVVLPNGPLCRCGNFGCLESLVSESILLAKAKEIARYQPKGVMATCLAEKGGEITLSTFRRAVEAGDTDCFRLINQQAEYIAIALANFANLIDPELIIIGGDMGIALDNLIFPRIREAISRYTPYLTDMRFELSQLGPLAAPIGACALLLG
jgi:glucokinase